jgi:hypothetical protein
VELPVASRSCHSLWGAQANQQPSGVVGNGGFLKEKSGPPRTPVSQLTYFLAWLVWTKDRSLHPRSLPPAPPLSSQYHPL